MLQLKGVKRIYYSADGLLHQIPFAALSNTKSQTLGKQYNLVQMSSTSNVLPQNNKYYSGDILLAGGIDLAYDTTKKEREPINTNKATIAYRGSGEGSRGEEWTYLLGTKSEIEQISEIASQSGVNAKVLSGKKATEEQIKILSGNSPSILHIAAHGFFFENPKNKQDRNRMSEEESQFVQAEDPLLRSGLILAGGNYAWKNGAIHTKRRMEYLLHWKYPIWT